MVFESFFSSYDSVDRLIMNGQDDVIDGIKVAIQKTLEVTLQKPGNHFR